MTPARRSRSSRGGGVQGVFIVAQPGLDTPAKLKGKTLGTFQNDTLEVLPYDWLKKNGVSYKDVTVRYMDSMGDMVAAFKAGAIDIASTIEPYGSALLSDVKGFSSVVRRRRHLWTGIHRLRARRQHETAGEGPQERQGADQGDAEGAAAFGSRIARRCSRELVGTYYKTSLENARIGGKAQPAKVDQRAQRTSS